MKLNLIVRYILLVIIANGCANEDSYTPQYITRNNEHNIYLLGVHPLHNPERLFEVYGPLADYLSDSIENIKFKLEASRNYAEYEKKLYDGKFQLAIPNPYQTLLSLDHNFHVIGKMADNENFRGVILVRKDSGINEITDLKGKIVCYPAPTALAATLLPQHYMQTHGLNVNKDIDEEFVGSQESSIMNVYMGHAAAGCTWIPPWKAFKKQKPELANEIELKWTTQYLPNNGVIIRNDIDEKIEWRIQTLLSELSSNERGRVILKRMELSAFEIATNESYKPVEKFLKEYQKKVRNIELQ